MIQDNAPLHSVEEIASNIFRLSFISPVISRTAVPGQFVNVRIQDSDHPLLRRPFSIFSVQDEIVSIIFNVVGLGTLLLSQKRRGDLIDVLGPLGNGVFPVCDPATSTFIIVAGGLGVAAFPFFTSRVPSAKKLVTFLGARSSAQIVRTGLKNIRVATDDGTEGFHGTVVELLKRSLDEHTEPNSHIVGCGPTPMMRALSKAASERNIPCHLALECEMACGIGLCQGCPVEIMNGEKKYRLVCKDGPVFDAAGVRL